MAASLSAIATQRCMALTSPGKRSMERIACRMDRWMCICAGICSLDAWQSIQLYDWQAKGKGTHVVVAFGYKGGSAAFVQSDRAGKAAAAAEVTSKSK